jgi:hypothetical protein
MDDYHSPATHSKFGLTKPQMKPILGVVKNREGWKKLRRFQIAFRVLAVLVLILLIVALIIGLNSTAH